MTDRRTILSLALAFIMAAVTAAVPALAQSPLDNPAALR
jgi:hypothetical protein